MIDIEKEVMDFFDAIEEYGKNEDNYAQRAIVIFTDSTLVLPVTSKERCHEVIAKMAPYVALRNSFLRKRLFFLQYNYLEMVKVGTGCYYVQLTSYFLEKEKGRPHYPPLAEVELDLIMDPAITKDAIRMAETGNFSRSDAGISDSDGEQFPIQ